MALTQIIVLSIAASLSFLIQYYLNSKVQVRYIDEIFHLNMT